MFRTGNPHRLEFSLKQVSLGALPDKVHWSGTDSRPEKLCPGDQRGVVFFRELLRGLLGDKGMFLTWCWSVLFALGESICHCWPRRKLPSPNRGLPSHPSQAPPRQPLTHHQMSLKLSPFPGSGGSLISWLLPADLGVEGKGGWPTEMERAMGDHEVRRWVVEHMGAARLD